MKNNILAVIAMLFIVDLAILFMTIGLIANGVDIPRIPFWDWQINILGNILIWITP